LDGHSLVPGLPLNLLDFFIPFGLSANRMVAFLLRRDVAILLGPLAVRRLFEIVLCTHA
jgi:hypothetical protein